MSGRERLAIVHDHLMGDGLVVLGFDDERIAAKRQSGQPTSMVVRRGGERLTLILPG